MLLPDFADVPEVEFKGVEEASPHELDFAGGVQRERDCISSLGIAINQRERESGMAKCQWLIKYSSHTR